VNSLDSGVKAYELLRYNDLGHSKYSAMGLPGYLCGGKEAVPQTAEALDWLSALIRKKVRKEIAVFCDGNPVEA